MMSNINVLVTGASGFIGKNLVTRLNELGIKTVCFTRNNSIQDLPFLLKEIDFIVHLAGENRPTNEDDFEKVNAGLTSSICEAIRSLDKSIPIIFASSTQAELNNAYGNSKLNAEKILQNFEADSGSDVYIYRLPGVFGKWCRPNYNSVVATFCHNISHNLPLQINDPSFELTLVYVDDVVEEFVKLITTKEGNNKELSIKPEYKIRLGDLATQIERFRESRESLIIEKVGDGLTRKLYSTYVSYLSPEQFSYSIPAHGDERGIFVEMLKTLNSGQFSFFTAHPGVTRGGHYHHTKTEKFLVIKGKAEFGFRNILTDEKYLLRTSEESPEVVETVPGWTHDITNIGNDDLIVMLWANEVFDQEKPDTFMSRILSL